MKSLATDRHKIQVQKQRPWVAIQGRWRFCANQSRLIVGVFERNLHKHPHVLLFSQSSRTIWLIRDI
jgi:hypothetical protein